MKNIEIKLKRILPSARIPEYVHRGRFGDLAADIYAAESASLAPGEVKPVRTGIAIEFPDGFGGIVADRSGLALRGLTTLAGVIDPGFRGEIRVVLTNLGSETIAISSGDRIAQLVVIERIEGVFQEVDTLDSSQRDDRGFGSSGR